MTCTNSFTEASQARSAASYVADPRGIADFCLADLGSTDSWLADLYSADGGSLDHVYCSPLGVPPCPCPLSREYWVHVVSDLSYCGSWCGVSLSHAPFSGLKKKKLPYFQIMIPYFQQILL